MSVRRVRGALSPAAVRVAARGVGSGESLLLVCDTATRGVLDLAISLRVSLIAVSAAVHGNGSVGHLVVGADGLVRLGSGDDEADVRRRGVSGPPRWARLAVVRALVLLGPRSQVGMAALVGVSQPRISQIYRDLTSAGLLADRGRRVPNWEGLLDHWLSTYPGAGGVTTYWYGLASAAEQALAVVDRLAALSLDRLPALVSGDVAADLLTPWGRPSTAVVYARAAVDLDDLKLTPSPAAGATLAVTLPRDPGVWLIPPARRRWSASPLPLADPLQILHDLAASSAPDADQTAARLREHLARQVVQWWQGDVEHTGSLPSRERQGVTGDA